MVSAHRSSSFWKGSHMNMRQFLYQGVAWLAVGAMCVPISAVAANEATPNIERAAKRSGSAISDVALAPGGMLVGQLLDEAMQPVRGAAVEVQADGQTTASTVTDANGVFAVSGLRGGVHQVVAQNTVENCRLWAPGTAPPNAQPILRYVPGQESVVRGQWTAPSLLTNPWVIGGIVVAAVATPILINNLDDDDDDDGS